MKNNSTDKKEFFSNHGVLVFVADISLIFIAVMAVICIISYFSLIVGISLGALFIAAYFIAVFYYIPLYYRTLSYSADNNSITIKKGLFFRRNIRIAFNDIQYCIISQGIIQKLFKSCSVYIMLTGSFTVISNISLEDAETINEMTFPQSKDRSGETNEE